MSSLSVVLPQTTNAERARLALDESWPRCCQALARYFAVRTGNDVHRVDELMQQLWLRACQRVADLREADPEPWLWRIAQNLLREHWRRARRAPDGRAVPDSALARALAEKLDTRELPEDLLARREVRDQLLLALTALPAAEQELLIGHYFDGRPQRDLAAALGLSERAVEGRLYRARLALRDRLSHLYEETGS